MRTTSLLMLAFLPYQPVCGQTSAPASLARTIVLHGPERPDCYDIGYMAQPNFNPLVTQGRSQVLLGSYVYCEVFDFDTKGWKLKEWVTTRSEMRAASTCDLAFFAGGKTTPDRYSKAVDVYNYNTGRWITHRLSNARSVGGAASCASMAYFAGGQNAKGYSNLVDIFDNKGKHSMARLSEARNRLSAGSIGDVIVFAGGLSGDPKKPTVSSAVDIYEVNTGSRALHTLCEARHSMAVASGGGKIIFAGGCSADSIPSDKVDIYDAGIQKWTSHKMPEAKYSISPAFCGHYMLFAGGITRSGSLSKRVEIYNLLTGEWTFTVLDTGRAGMTVAAADAHIYFAGGYIKKAGSCTNRIDIFNISDRSWIKTDLLEARQHMAGVHYQNKVLFAGGSQSRDWGAEVIPSAQVEYFNMAVPADIRVSIIDAVDKDTSLYMDLMQYEYLHVNLAVYDVTKKLLISRDVVPVGITTEQLSLASLPCGAYYLIVTPEGTRPIVAKFTIADHVREWPDKKPALYVSSP